jgi:Ca2+-binding RTX toxin-like protein
VNEARAAVGRATVTIVAASVSAMLLLPGAALGSDVSVSGKTLKVTDPANVAQNQTVSFDAATATFEITDGGGPMAAVAPCVAGLGGTAVRCPASGVTQIQVLGNGGIDDMVIQPSVPATVRALLSGGAGADVLTGGSGADTLDGGDGGDILAGGAGVDQVSYALRFGPAGVRIRMGAGPVSGNGADGPPGGRDRILADIEGATGSPQNDVIVGTATANVLSGAGGLDKIAGRLGGDRILGGAKRDVLRGGPGPDKLIGGTGADSLAGQGGIDKLLAADGLADFSIDCGAPAAPELAVVDGLDPAPVDC